MGSEATEILARRGFEDPIWFLRFFLPHVFTDEIPWFWRAIIAILLRKVRFLEKYGEIDKILQYFNYIDDAGSVRPVFGYVDGKLVLFIRQYTLLMIPRGNGKTSVAGLGCPVYDIAYARSPFNVYLSDTGPHCKMQLENVKNELSMNEKFRSVFGDLKPTYTDDERWAADFFQTLNGCAWAARGRGAQVRGMNHHGFRPRKIVVDDLENLETVATEDQRNKTRNYFFGDVLPALDQRHTQASIVMLATMLHSDGLPNRLMTDPMWSVVKFASHLSETELLWPEYMTEEKLTAIKQSYANAGMLHRYYLEYENDAKPAETQKFRKEYFLHGPLEGNVVATALYCDPAISKRKGADEAVILAVSMTDKGKHFVRDGWAKKGAEPRELIDQYFEMSKKFRCTKHGIESNGYQASLQYIMREEMFRKKHYFEIEPVTNTLKKAERIMGILQPRYANGYIVHCHPMFKLETQLLDYDPNKDEQADDWPDSLAGAISLLEPYAAMAAAKDPTDESDYDEIDENLQEAWYH